MPLTMSQSKMARNDLAVKMGADVVKMAKHIAIDRGITLAEYLTERVRPLVEEDFEVMAKTMGKSQPRRAKKGTEEGGGK
jgi:hypothetical protein